MWTKTAFLISFRWILPIDCLSCNYRVTKLSNEILNYCSALLLFAPLKYWSKYSIGAQTNKIRRAHKYGAASLSMFKQTTSGVLNQVWSEPEFQVSACFHSGTSATFLREILNKCERQYWLMHYRVRKCWHNTVTFRDLL